MRAEIYGGVGMKPGDRYTVPACTRLVAKQHRVIEVSLSPTLRIDSQPGLAAMESGRCKGQRERCSRARQQMNLTTAYT